VRVRNSFRQTLASLGDTAEVKAAFALDEPPADV
jgi:hypothetical protein